MKIVERQTRNRMREERPCSLHELDILLASGELNAIPLRGELLRRRVSTSRFRCSDGLAQSLVRSFVLRLGSPIIISPFRSGQSRIG